MIRKRRFILIIMSLLLSGNACNAQYYSPEDVELRKEIGQMLMIGFRGTEVTTGNTICRDISEYNIGGVILFEYDAPSQSRPRNITNLLQGQKLCRGLQKLANGNLLIAIDQEGGKVNRLKSKYGFPEFVSAKTMGIENNSPYTRECANLTAKTLKSIGINLNFAPCVDLDVNPNCPVIGKLGRSFSANPMIVIKHARLWIEEHNKLKVISSLKHFPGHGSSQTDTHLGIADVSNSWTETELIPYQALIDSQMVDMIMTSHVFNAQLDSVYPATLSKKILTDLLRNKMGYNGVIVTDDLAMGAMTKHYSLEDMLELAILAGADILCLSNNGTTYDPDIAPKAVQIIYNKVIDGKISRERIHQSYVRIQKLKNKIQ
ncbi:MAG: hypothetical protein IKD33_01860 [Bacteroidales bacterium]|nr:hypothetical protein [Bacteroidales bacterium]